MTLNAKGFVPESMGAVAHILNTVDETTIISISAKPKYLLHTHNIQHGK